MTDAATIAEIVRRLQGTPDQQQQPQQPVNNYEDTYGMGDVEFGYGLMNDERMSPIAQLGLNAWMETPNRQDYIDHVIPPYMFRGSLRGQYLPQYQSDIYTNEGAREMGAQALDPGSVINYGDTDATWLHEFGHKGMDQLHMARQFPLEDIDMEEAVMHYNYFDNPDRAIRMVDHYVGHNMPDVPGNAQHVDDLAQWYMDEQMARRTGRAPNP